MQDTNARKAKQLGMPLGTARGKLIKRILFDLARRLGLLACYRCTKPIESVNDLTVEHKLRWLDADPALFWDLSNIAFSHSVCNRPDRPHNLGQPYPRKVGPPGTAWCQKHKDFLPVEQFAANRSRWNGLQYRCRDCHNSSTTRRSGPSRSS
jgi:5-methylcytosine-specific restriction endonuclease McrA